MSTIINLAYSVAESAWWMLTRLLLGVAIFIAGSILYRILVNVWPDYSLKRKKRLQSNLEKEALSAMNKDKKTLITEEYRQLQLDRLVTATGNDLADFLRLPATDIHLSNIIKKKWTDSSLECPAAQETPVLQDLEGWLIVWKLGEKQYRYHTTVFGDWRRCSEETIPSDIYDSERNPGEN